MAITTVSVPSPFCILLSYCYLSKLKKKKRFILSKKIGHMGPSFRGLKQISRETLYLFGTLCSCQELSLFPFKRGLLRSQLFPWQFPRTRTIKAHSSQSDNFQSPPSIENVLCKPNAGRFVFSLISKVFVTPTIHNKCIAI